MQHDARRLTVAHDHLETAYEEVTRAVGLTERSMSEQAARRALTQLDMVLRKLQDEAVRGSHGSAAEVANRTLHHARHAWQSLHDALNDWEYAARRSLDAARSSIIAALETIRVAEQTRGDRDFAHS